MKHDKTGDESIVCLRAYTNQTEAESLAQQLMAIWCLNNIADCHYQAGEVEEEEEEEDDDDDDSIDWEGTSEESSSSDSDIGGEGGALWHTSFLKR